MVKKVVLAYSGGSAVADPHLAKQGVIAGAELKYINENFKNKE